MLRPPEALKRRLTDAGMLALCTWALAGPVLHLFGLERESGYALLFTGLLSLVFSSIAAIGRRWLRAALRLAVIALGLWFVFTSPILGAGKALIEASAAFRPAQHIVLLYSDLLIPLFIALLMPYIRLLMQGEPSFSAPLLLVSVLMVWFSGARQSITAYLPAMAAVPLLYAYAAQTQAPGVNAGKARRSFLKAVPVALAIALAAFAFTPPYRSTVPALEKKADELRQLIKDYFFFTESRENFSLASEGYQPMGDKGLGGKPAISNTPVMQVETDRRVYLRGGILNLYNGRAWHDTISNERYGYTTIRFSALRDALLDAALPRQDLRTQALTVNVSMLSPMPSTLFVPQRLRSLSAQEGMVPYINASSEMFITRNLLPGDGYALSYEPYIAGTQQTDSLAAKLSGATDERFEEMKADYLQLPSHLLPDGQVAGLARSIVGGEDDPYRMALLIRDYLKSDFSYTLDVADAPQDMDFVAHFIQTRQGYCTYFASAMTVLSRSVGLPARYIEGFVAIPGEDDAPALITGQHAHAWTEIYIPALGWVTFDATAATGELPPQPDEPPGGDEPDDPFADDDPQQQEQEGPEGGEEDRPEGDEPEPSPSPEPSQPPEEEQQQDRDDPAPAAHPGTRLWWLWLLVLAALTALCVWRVRALDPTRQADRSPDNSAKLLIYWDALCAALARQGKGQLPQETLRGYAQRIAPQDPGLLKLAEDVSAVLYGKHGTDNQQVMTARLYWQSAYAALSRVKRMALIAGRLRADVISRAAKAFEALTSAAKKALSRPGKTKNKKDR